MNNFEPEQETEVIEKQEEQENKEKQEKKGKKRKKEVKKNRKIYKLNLYKRALIEECQKLIHNMIDPLAAQQAIVKNYLINRVLKNFLIRQKELSQKRQKRRVEVQKLLNELIETLQNRNSQDENSKLMQGPNKLISRESKKSKRIIGRILEILFDREFIVLKYNIEQSVFNDLSMSVRGFIQTFQIAIVQSKDLLEIEKFRKEKIRKAGLSQENEHIEKRKAMILILQKYQEIAQKEPERNPFLRDKSLLPMVVANFPQIKIQKFMTVNNDLFMWDLERVQMEKDGARLMKIT